MPSHQLKIDLIGGEYVFFCECGQWQLKRAIQPGQRVIRMFQEIEEEFEKHLSQGSGQGNSNPVQGR